MEEMFRKLLAEQRAEIEKTVRQQMGVQANLVKGLPEQPYREIWAQWEVEELHPVGRRSLRNDIHTCDQNKPLVLDLAFQWEGRHNCTIASRKQAPCTAPTPHVHLGDFPTCDLTKQIGGAWFAQLRITPRKLRHKSKDTDYRTPGSLNRVLTSAQGCLTWRCGKLNNPLKGIPISKVPKDPRKGCFFRDEEELEDFLLYVNPTLKDMARLSTFCGGMRAKEVRLLRITEVDWEARKVVLPDSEVGEERRTKGGTGRDMTLLDREYEMLVVRRAAAEALGTEYFFPSPQPKWRKRDPEACRQPVPVETLTHWMDAAARRWEPNLLNGKHKPIFHAFRHTWGTWAAFKGMPLNAMMAEAGWSDPKIAMRYMQYARSMATQTKQTLSRSVREVLKGRKREQREEGDE